MTRKRVIISVVIILILVGGGYTGFWFSRANTVKKITLNILSSKDGSNSVGKVTVSGFPFKQIVTIEDIKAEGSADKSELNSTTAEYSQMVPMTIEDSTDNYQVHIKTIQFSSSIFKNDFTLTNLGEITMQEKNGVSYLVKPNQMPFINFAFQGNLMTKLIYKDNGHKIIDAKNNSVFVDVGTTNIDFSSARQGEKYNGKLNVSAKSVVVKDLFDDLETQKPAINNVSPTAAVGSVPAQPQGIITPPPAIESGVAATQPVENKEPVKHDFIIDLDYVVLFAPDTNPATAGSVKKPGELKMKIESLNIRQVEISDPSYKVTLKGNFNRNQKGDSLLFDTNVSIEKFDNFANYVNSIFKEIAKKREAQMKAAQPQIAAPAVVQTDVPVAQSTTSEANILATNEKPKIEISALVTKIFKDLGTKNSATNDQLTVFNLKREEGKKSEINGVAVEDVLMQVMFAFFSQMAEKQSQNGGNANIIKMEVTPLGSPDSKPVNNVVTPTVK